MRTDTVQNNFLSGVIDPRAYGRVETDSYNNGLTTGTNVVPVHLGGVRRRPGMRYVAQLANILTRVTPVTPTAVNGGTAANGNDDNDATLVTTTNNVGVINPYVVLQYDLGSLLNVSAVDVMGIKSSGGSSTEFWVQYSQDNVAWGFLGDSDIASNAFALVDTTSRSYRSGATRPGGAVAARYIRLVKIGGTNMGAVTITVSGMNVWLDSGVLSESRCIPFEVSTSEPYMLALTDRSIAVYNDGGIVRLAPSPYASADLAEIDASGSAETLAIVHEDYAPRFFLREAVDNFQLDTVVFDALPTFDFNDSSSPTPTSDVQTITFSAGWVQGDTFQIDLQGAKTGPVTFAGDTTANQQTATASNIARAVQALYTVEGFEGVSCARTGALTYVVTLAAGSANAYQLMSVIGLSATGGAAASVAHTTTGSPRTESVWSATRGYPRTVTFFEGRLYFGGTRSLQQSLFGSEVNNILNFDTGQGLADEPIFVTLTGAQLNAINGLFAGRSLQVFTSGGEFRFVKQQGVPIVPGDSPVPQTQYGAKKIRPVSIDGATLFVQRTGKAIRDFRFNFEEDAYDSLGVSSLAPHLINDVVDIAAWNGSREDEIGLTFVINGDGTAAVFNSRKEAQIQAWVPWTTDGLFKSVGVVFQDRYFTATYEIDGVTGTYLLLADEDHYMDCSIAGESFTPAADDQTIIGIGEFFPLIGQEVRVRVNGFTLEDNTVESYGGILVDYANATSAEIGLSFNPVVTPMPLNTMTPTGPNFSGKRRVVKVWVRVRNTQGLRVNGRVLSDRYFDINNFDQASMPVSKWLALEETTNWDFDQDKLVTFDQVDPMPMEILAIKVQLESQP